MAIIKAFAGALGGTFADLWKDIITAGRFDEYVVVAPGVPRGANNGRGSNEYGSEGVISNGSHIYVPENTGAFIFSESGIENVITEPGGYEYRDARKACSPVTASDRCSVRSPVDSHSAAAGGDEVCGVRQPA